MINNAIGESYFFKEINSYGIHRKSRTFALTQSNAKSIVSQKLIKNRIDSWRTINSGAPKSTNGSGNEHQHTHTHTHAENDGEIASKSAESVITTHRKPKQSMEKAKKAETTTRTTTEKGKTFRDVCCSCRPPAPPLCPLSKTSLGIRLNSILSFQY